MSGSYVLTEAAESDLRDIVRYTSKTWGTAQARQYAKKLMIGMDHVSSGTSRFRPLTEIHPALRSLHCGHHYIFCIMRKNAPALIVAILHERMDLVARLEHRLR